MIGVDVVAHGIHHHKLLPSQLREEFVLTNELSLQPTDFFSLVGKFLCHALHLLVHLLVFYFDPSNLFFEVFRIVDFRLLVFLFDALDLLFRNTPNTPPSSSGVLL